MVITYITRMYPENYINTEFTKLIDDTDMDSYQQLTLKIRGWHDSKHETVWLDLTKEQSNMIRKILLDNHS